MTDGIVWRPALAQHITATACTVQHVRYVCRLLAPLIVTALEPRVATQVSLPPTTYSCADGQTEQDLPGHQYLQWAVGPSMDQVSLLS